jgi:hypothetical protein
MTAFLLLNQLEVSVYLNDLEYPLGAVNLLNSMHIVTTARGSVPLLSMQITDVQGLMEVIGLKDGIPIRVVIKAIGKNATTYNFLLFTSRKEQSGGSYTYTIFGYWKAPLYWNSSTSTPIKGTSDDALSQIADACGLDYDGTDTGDSQLWLPQNKLYRAWAKAIAGAGYVDDTSCMALAVDLDNTLVYKNLNDLDAPTKSIVAYQYSKQSYTAVDFKSKTVSGFNNAVTGYNNMRYVQSTVGDDTQTSIENLTFTPDVTSPLYNQDLKDQMARGAVRFGPIDVGNVHEQYEKALYQNLRYMNLFNFGLDALLQMPTEIGMFEQIDFSVQKEDTSVDKINSGTYTVAARALYIQGATYNELIGLVRHGTNADKG